MNLIMENKRPLSLPRNVSKKQGATVPDHDLPILAVECDSHPRPDWETLMVSGVPPALALGAERRWRGRR